MSKAQLRPMVRGVLVLLGGPTPALAAGPTDTPSGAPQRLEAISLDIRTEAFEPQDTFALTMSGGDIAQDRLGYASFIR
jgi:hypothetical protein